MDSEKPDSEMQDSEEQDLKEQRHERIRAVMATYLKYPPGVREQAVQNLLAKLGPVESGKK